MGKMFAAKAGIFVTTVAVFAAHPNVETFMGAAGAGLTVAEDLVTDVAEFKKKLYCITYNTKLY